MTPEAQARATRRASWESLDALSCAAGRVCHAAPDDARCPTSSGCRRAPCLRACTAGIALPEPTAAGVTAERAWKLFLLVPRLLLTRPRETGAAGRTALLQRFQAFEAGRWRELLDAATLSAAQPQRSTGSDVRAGPPW